MPETMPNPEEFKTSVSKPPVESFLDPVAVTEVLPEEVTSNPDFKEQCQDRKELCQSIDGVIDALSPTESVSNGIRNGKVSAKLATKLYKSLSGTLSDEDYQRLLLYLPFEFIPDADFKPEDAELESAQNDFKSAYLKAWHELLYVHDVRANFVDGDVIEVSQRSGDLPRVVKAAHMVPKMVEKGLISVTELAKIINNTEDPLLIENLYETLPILEEMGLLPDSVKHLFHGLKPTKTTNESGGEQVEEEFKLIDIQNELENRVNEIETADYGDITKKRQEWLIQVKKQELISATASQLSRAITSESISAGEISTFLLEESSDPIKFAIINAIRRAIESAANANPENAKIIFSNYQNVLVKLWQESDGLSRDLLTKTFRRLYHLGIVTQRQLDELGVIIPLLSGPFSENLKHMSGEINQIKKNAAGIEANSELSDMVYPVSLVYGSRLKGYGEQNSDIDVAVFVKPGVTHDKQAQINELLNNAFTVPGVHDGIIQFWLNQEGTGLTINDFPEADGALGESYWTHIVLGAAWAGNTKAAHELQKKLLPQYFYESQKEIKGKNIRNVYLEEMEKDTLQYRLMHKGHERFFPSQGGLQTQHSELVDADSAFWDSGYRRIATKLYASRVFLPKLTR